MPLLEIISLLFIIVINTVVFWVIASQSWRIVVNRYFVTAVSFVILWATGTLLLIASKNGILLSVGTLLFLVAPMFLILFLSLFAAIFPHEKGKALTAANIFLLAVTAALSILIVFDPSLFMTATIVTDASNDIAVNSFWYSIYVFYFNSAFLIAFSELFLHIGKSRGHQRQQLIYIFTGTFMAAIFSLASNLILPIFGETQFIWLGPTWTLFYVITVSISIVKHRLFDIKLAAVRSVAYIGALATMSLIYYATAYLISFVVIGSQVSTAISVSPFNILLALILAFLFQPIKHFFDKVTDNIFYRNNYRSEDFFNTLSNVLTSTTDLRNLLERASRQISLTFKAEQVSFFVYYGEENEHHMSAGTQNHTRIPRYDVQMLDRHVAANLAEKVIFTDFIAEDDAVRRMLHSHRIAIVMPLRQGDVTAGYLLLGDHLSGSYTKRDLNVLLAVSNELVIAIQNALSLQELKELNATLQQRIDVATKELRSSNAQLKHLDEVKDEFMSMASHQLRTPLTSVKGYISMVLEGDAGKVSPQQDKLLTEAFKSSERMVRLIADFLNVSRLQTGKFSIEKAPMDIKETVRQEVENLDFIAHTHNQKIRATVTHDALPLRADESKVRQVIMNLIDNAIYYSHPHTTIVVRLEKVGDSAAFTVTDTGIGVPEDEQHKLFGKFFRAGNARKQRPDGTGVGLYLARRVVTGHGGSIIFSSKEGKGSTFGFKLPLDTSGK